MQLNMKMISIWLFFLIGIPVLQSDVPTAETLNELLKEASRFEKQGNTEEALKYYQEYYEKTVREKKDKILLKIARLSADFSETQLYYQALLKEFPQSSLRYIARMELADLFLLYNRPHDALKEYLRLAGQPDAESYCTKSLIKAGAIEINAGDYSSASAHLYEALKGTNDYEDTGTIYYLSGCMMQKQKLYTEAERFFLTCTGSFPYCSRAVSCLYELAGIYLMRRQIADANRMVRMIRSFYPDSLENRKVTEYEKKITTLKKPDNQDDLITLKILGVKSDLTVQEKSRQQITRDLFSSSLENSDDLHQQNNNNSSDEKQLYLQLGYFINLENAKSQISLYHRQGLIEVYLAKTHSTSSGNQAYRVLLGPYPTGPSANKKLIELKEKNIEAIILELVKQYE